jgi:hypothetical protein
MNETQRESTGNRIKQFAPMLAAGGGALLLMLFKKARGSRGPKLETHYHGPLDHVHEHVHVTHNRTDDLKGVGGWQHLTASHSHRHNHASLEHTHRPHRHFEEEHRTEAHIHDHDEPVG